MITEKNFSKDWIYNICNLLKRGKKKADPELTEKVVYALYLLESIKKAGLKFIFKGGTALLLLFNEIHRFSIDIDILVEKDINNRFLNKIFRSLINSNKVFYEFEESERINTKKIKKTHFKFFYKSALDSRNKYILLDIVFNANPFPEVIEKEISCDLLDTEGETINVSMPSIECILADKLTAFAPNTTGIPYGVNKELEIIKQFDISILFNGVKNLDKVNKTFKNVAEIELDYRELLIDLSKVYDDIIDTSLIIAFRGKIKKEEFTNLLEGIKRIRGFIISKNFILEEAILSASKAAYLTVLLKNKINRIEFFDTKENAMNLNIVDKKFRKSFRSIKKFSLEAYYYWYKFVEIYSREKEI